MTLVGEIAAASQLLADIVKNTKTVVDAVNDGRKYLESRHPDAVPQFAALLREMRVTVVGLAEATKIVSRFRFTVEGADMDSEARRFNDYVLEQEARVIELKQRIRDLKGSCDKIRELRDDLDRRSKSRDWAAMFGLLGDKARQRATELAGPLSQFYADDQRMIEAIQNALDLSQRVLAEVEEALGPPGSAYPHNVPVAARVLGTYANVFEQQRRELDELALPLEEAAAALG